MSAGGGAPRAILIGVGGFGCEWWDPLDAAGVDVAGLVDPDPAALAAAEARFPAARRSSGSDAGWTRWDADFAIDCSPPWFRRQHCLAAFGAGLDVLAAKPLGDTFDVAREIVAAARAAGRTLAVAHQKRHLPGFEELRRIVADGGLGRPGIVNLDLNVDGTSWRPGMEWRLRMPSPLLIEGATHQFDLVRWVLGADPAWVLGAAFNPPWSAFAGDACLTAFLALENGVHVSYRASWAPRGSPIVTFFSGWRLELEGGLVELDEGEVLVDGRPVGVRCGETTLASLNAVVLGDFLDALATGRRPLLHGDEALRSFAIVEACRRSLDLGRRVAVAEVLDAPADPRP